jgi:hypothetical protein
MADRVLDAISAVSADLAAIGIGKDSRNKEQSFNYRGIDAVMNTLAPLLVKHRLVVFPEYYDRVVTEKPTKSGGVMFNVVLRAVFRFVSLDDGSERSVQTYGEGQDSADKATNKAMAIAYKYAAFLMFCIPLEPTADPDAHTPEATHRTPDPTKNNLTDLTQEFDLRALEAASLKELADLFASAQAEIKKAAVDRECDKAVLVDALGALGKGKDAAKARLEKKQKDAKDNKAAAAGQRGDEPGGPQDPTQEKQ